MESWRCAQFELGLLLLHQVLESIIEEFLMLGQDWLELGGVHVKWDAGVSVDSIDQEQLVILLGERHPHRFVRGKLRLKLLLVKASSPPSQEHLHVLGEQEIDEALEVDGVGDVSLVDWLERPRDGLPLHHSALADKGVVGGLLPL